MVVLGGCVDAYILYIFNRNIYGKVRQSVPIWCLLAAFFLVEVLMNVCNFLWHNEALNMGVGLVTLIALSLLYDADWSLRLKGTVLFQGVAIISELAAARLFEVIPNIPEQSQQTVGSFVSKNMLFLFGIFVQVLNNRRQRLPQKYVITYAVIPVLSIAILLGLYIGSNPWDMYMHFLAFGLLFISLFSYYLLNSLANYITEQKNVEQFIQQMEIQNEKYAQLILAFRKGNSVIHDIDKHMRYIHQCLNAGEMKEAEAYLREMDQFLKENYYDVQTGNLVIDAIISNMKVRLRDMQCEPEIHINVTAHAIRIPDFDFTTILGNIVDNQIEAVCDVEGQKYVYLEITQKNNMLMIRSRNNYVDKVESHQEEALFHGTGLLHVKSTLEKYGGTIISECEDQIYETCIVIPMEEA